MIYLNFALVVEGWDTKGSCGRLRGGRWASSQLSAAGAPNGSFTCLNICAESLNSPGIFELNCSES